MPLFHGFSEACRQNFQLFAVFSDGAASHFHSLFFEGICKGLIGKRGRTVFVCYKILDGVKNFGKSKDKYHYEGDDVSNINIYSLFRAKDSVRCMPDFKFKDGIYFSRFHLNLNLPVCFGSLGSIKEDISPFEVDTATFLQALVKYDKVGYCCGLYSPTKYVAYVINGQLTIKYRKEWWRVDSVSNLMICPDNAILEFKEGISFSQKKFGDFLKVKDTLLYEEFLKIPEKQRLNHIKDFIAKYNESHPLYFPVFEDDDYYDCSGTFLKIPQRILGCTESYGEKYNKKHLQRLKYYDINEIIDKWDYTDWEREEWLRRKNDTTHNTQTKIADTRRKSCTRLNGVMNIEAIDTVEYTSDFKFTDGVYFCEEDFLNNLPIPFDRFPKKKIFGPRLLIKDNGDTTEIGGYHNDWGYCKNGEVYKRSDNHLRVELGRLCKYTIAENKTREVSDVMGGTMTETYTDDTYYLLDYHTGESFLYTTTNLEDYLEKNDPELYEEYHTFSKREKWKRSDYFVYKFNGRHPMKVAVY